MFKKLLFSCLFAAFFTACTNDSSTSGTVAAVKTGTQLQEIIDKPMAETDLFARANQGMAKLMMNYTHAAGVIDGFDKPSYTMDEKCNVRFMYEENGVAYEKRFNIGDLAHKNGKISLQADEGDIKFPGFIIETETGEPLIEIYKEGKLLQKDNEWYIVLADRATVEKAVPNMINVVNVCRQANGKE